MNAERIKALLDEHGWVTPPKGGCACLCGWTGRLSDHRAHVAEVIAREAAERETELLSRVEYVTQLNTEKAAAIRQAQARIAEVAGVAEERGYEVQRLREREARLRALADDWERRELDPWYWSEPANELRALLDQHEGR